VKIALYFFEKNKKYRLGIKQHYYCLEGCWRRYTKIDSRPKVEKYIIC